MRTVSRNTDEQQAMIWETLLPENRSRISRVLARVIAELLFAPADRDDDGFGRRDEPG